MELRLDDVEGLLDLDLNVLLALNKRVVDERIKEGDDVLRIFTKDSLDHLAVTLKHTLFFEDTEGIHDVLGQTEGDNFRDFKLCSFFKDAIKVDMCHFSCVLMNKDVITMSVTQTYDITDHRPNGCRPDKVDTSLIPDLWAWEMIRHPVAKDRFNFFFHLVPYLFMSLPLFKVYSFLFYVMHLSFDVVTFPLLTHDRLERGCILNPLNHTCGTCERYYGVGSQS